MAGRRADDDARCERFIGKSVDLAVGCEGVSRPLAGGREIELVVRHRAVGGDEGLEARVLPKLVSDARRTRIW